MKNPPEGWKGWDAYAPFYDWENARTLGSPDVPFWTRVVERANGRVLELGCGTGRITRPLAKAGVDIVGVDRSAGMLGRARAANASRASALNLVRADIRALPFHPGSFAAVIAPYGVLQSLTRPRDLTATLEAVARVIAKGGTLGIDLVPDVPHWKEYRNKVRLRGRDGDGHLTLVESVRQDRRRRLTTFEQRYIERRGRRTAQHCFELTFRTVTVPDMARRLERTGFTVQKTLGNYHGRPWDPRANVWIILAERG